MATKSNALEAEAPVSAAGTLKPQYLEAVTAAGVRTLTSQPPTLEELFLRHYGDRVEPPGAE